MALAPQMLVTFFVRESGVPSEHHINTLPALKLRYTVIITTNIGI